MWTEPITCIEIQTGPVTLQSDLIYEIEARLIKQATFVRKSPWNVVDTPSLVKFENHVIKVSKHAGFVFAARFRFAIIGVVIVEKVIIETGSKL